MKTETIRVGKQVLDIITSGMYSNALMVIREYIQNSADAIDDAIAKGVLDYASSKIEISLNGEERSITIIDNGSGVPASKVNSILSGIALSSKSKGGFRGFRGIGRLGGLGYCDEVIFETRSNQNEPVTVAVWDSKVLRNECRDNGNNDYDLYHAVQKIIKINKRTATKNDLTNFFSVKMKNIHRYHKDELMNVDLVFNYISQVGPVPFNKTEFSFSNEIEKHLSDIDGYRVYNIFLNGRRVLKPHRDIFAISGQSSDQLKEVQLFELKGHNGNVIGKGWFAKCAFKASLLQSDKMRGLRLRQGNLEVGDEYFLAEMYSERRFSTWHIGEIHFNYSLRLNARRDGFEQSYDYESFLEQANLLCKHLSSLCRNASKSRSQQVQIQKVLQEAEESINIAILSNNNLRTEALSKAQKLLNKAHTFEDAKEKQSEKINDLLVCIDRIERGLSISSLLDGRILRGIEQKELIEEIATNIIKSYNNSTKPVDLVKAIIIPYLRNDVNLNQI